MIIFQVKMADRQGFSYWRDFYEFNGTEAEAVGAITQWRKEINRFACPVRVIERTEREILVTPIEEKLKVA